MKLPDKVEWVWDARWTSYWITDKELFEFTKNDFNKRANELNKAGINAVIIFGSFHFRWCFFYEREQILKAIKNACESCHKYGIRIVDHHSANLVSAPLGKEKVNSILRSRRGFSPKRHPGYIKLIKTGDAIFNGIRLSSMYQIDPRSGVFSRTNYNGWVLCHNNPDYQRLYFEYLEEIYKCNVDGIMTDDIGAMPQNYGCGCIYCREKFRKETGYEMPPNGFDDKKFYGNLNNPAYCSWLLWRLDTNRQHQKRVYDHFRSLKLELARPIYSSSSTNSYASRGFGFCIDNLDGFYSTVFTEVNCNESQPHSFLRIGAESKHRNALAYRNNVPSMCLFYPANKEINLFCWAMTKTWGQSYWGTNKNLTFNEEMKMVKVGFAFESKYPDLYQRPQPITEVAVLFSAHTVWLHDDNDNQTGSVNRSTGMSDPASTDCWAGWCEVLSLANIQFDTIGENDLEEKRYFDRLRMIIVPNSVCLSDKAVKALKEFANKGGKLIFTHQAGIKNKSGEWKKNRELSTLIGATYKDVIDQSPAWISTLKSGLGVKRCISEKTPAAVYSLNKGVETLMTLEGTQIPAVFKKRVGKGEVLTFAGKPGRIVCVNRHKKYEKDGSPLVRKLSRGEEAIVKIDFHMNRRVVKLMENSVRYLLNNEEQLVTEGVPRGFIIGMFGHGDRTILHITNASGVLQDSGKSIVIPTSALVFPQADSLPDGKKNILLKIRRKGTHAVLRSPEFSGEKTLACHREDEYAIVDIPADMVKCYSVVELK